MKKLLTIFAVLLVSAMSAYSVPAYPFPIKVTQPDGTTLTVQLYGDEFFNYTLDSDGRQVVKLSDQYYYYYNSTVYSKVESDRILVRAKVSGLRTAEESAFINKLPYGVHSEYETTGLSVASVKRQMRDSGFDGAYTPPYSASPQKSIGTVMFPPRAIVILAAYKDVPFNASHNVDTFDAMLNERGYSVNGAVGCARDFYYEGTFGQYDPVFDVSPIVTLSQNREYYGGNNTSGNDQRPDEMIGEACTLADPDVDFTQYDNDGDGYVDAVFVIFAGHNEAEGAATECIWPHRWYVYYKSVYVDGKRLGDYACTSELSGSSGSTLAGIGTFCHENGHVLGLPDYYDTDYTTNGYCVGLYNINVMCSGSYNSDGRIPPTFTAIERDFLGVMELEDITYADAGTYILEGLSSSNHAYRINSANSSNEYFILESIEETPWTAPYGATGMLISQNDHGSGYSSALNSNTLNNKTSHPYVRYRESYGSTLSSYSNVNVNYVVYPGSRNKTTFAEGDYGFESWDGEPLPIQISDMTNNAGTVSFYSDGGISVNNLIKIQGRYTTASVLYKNGADGWNFEYRVADSADEYTLVENQTAETIYLFGLQEATTYEAIVTPLDGSEGLSTTFQTNSGTSVEPKVTAGSTTATVSYANGEKGWSIYLQQVGSSSELSYLNIYETTYAVSNLKAETSYEYMIIPLLTDDIVVGEFTTIEEVNYTYPAIQGITGTYSIGDSFTLMAGGLKSTGTCGWNVNGTDYEDGEVITFSSAGQYEIECRIEYTDGSLESITRIVTVQ